MCLQCYKISIPTNTDPNKMQNIRIWKSAAQKNRISYNQGYIHLYPGNIRDPQGHELLHRRQGTQLRDLISGDSRQMVFKYIRVRLIGFKSVWKHAKFTSNQYNTSWVRTLYVLRNQMKCSIQIIKMHYASDPQMGPISSVSIYYSHHQMSTYHV